jgi:hypothetical protein
MGLKGTGPKKHYLGPQNDPISLGPEKKHGKLPGGRTIVNNWKRWVATDIHLDHRVKKIPKDNFFDLFMAL